MKNVRTVHRISSYIIGASRHRTVVVVSGLLIYFGHLFPWTVSFLVLALVQTLRAESWQLITQLGRRRKFVTRPLSPSLAKEGSRMPSIRNGTREGEGGGGRESERPP